MITDYSVFYIPYKIDNLLLCSYIRITVFQFNSLITSAILFGFLLRVFSTYICTGRRAFKLRSGVVQSGGLAGADGERGQDGAFMARIERRVRAGARGALGRDLLVRFQLRRHEDHHREQRQHVSALAVIFSLLILCITTFIDIIIPDSVSHTLGRLLIRHTLIH